VTSEDATILVQGAKSFDILLEKKEVDLFGLYLDELLKWNRKINLTAIQSGKEIVIKHFLDSLSVHQYSPGDSTLLDIGSGAGFPGIPLKIVQPSLRVTLIDSARKKVDFQKHIIRILGLKGIGAVHGRAQDKELLEQWTGRFDAVVSRAFSNLRTFLASGYPFLKKRGIAIAMKGKMPEGEIRFLDAAERNRYLLQRKVSLILPFSPFKRTILLFQKD
jgi:16S rRNA (guanine527-N7)-methyltransferase